MVRSGGLGTSSAGASAWSRYRELSKENRNERLVMRALLSVGAGVVVAGLSVWWAGIAFALGGFAGHTVYARVRPGPVTNWRRGATAERRTGRRLAKLDPAGFHVLHDRMLPGTPVTNLDHLVVGLTGVYAIASRRWRWGARLWTEGDHLWVGRRSAGKVQAPAVRAAAAVADLLTSELDYRIGVEAMVAVHGARLQRGGLRFGIGGGAVDLQPVRNLPRVISGRPVIFTSAQVATIAAAAERALPPMIANGIAE